MKKLSTRVIIRLALLTVAWLSLVLVLIGRTAEITPYTIFVIVASGIIVFVPMYKKYIKNDQR